MDHQEQDELTSASDSDIKDVRTPRVGFKRPQIDKFQFTSPSPRIPVASSKRWMHTPAARSAAAATTSSNQQFTVPGTAKDPPAEIEPLQVYCRIKLLELVDGESCVNVNDNHSITVFPPDSLAWTKAKQGKYSFDRIFSHTAPQKEVFDQVARPLVQDLLDGKSSLLFAFGVTGSGKTYTMCGTPAEPGIMPRALDVLFNSIGNRKAPKYSFKSDHMNGFEAQTKAEIQLQQLLLRSSSLRNLRSGTLSGAGDKHQIQFPVTDSETEEGERSHDSTILPIQFADSVFSVFVTYTQIYNKNVYDLLDDEVSLDLGKKTNGPQSKITRADATGNMYVHNVVEVEVESAEEALAVLKRGQKKRKFAQTLLNTESSRSHSIFNIRLVQAPLDARGEEIVDDKNSILVSQLSLVDLAGSERHTRTQTVGDRLREAGRINASIMNLHKCLVALRKRQQKGDSEKVTIPYRDDKLTDFLKSYFEGQGRIRMLLCINPRAEDYAENLHVCAFAEEAQEIDIVRQPVRIEPLERKILSEAPPPKVQMKDDNQGLIGSSNISKPLPVFQRFNTAGEWREPLMELRGALVDKMDGQVHFNSVLLEMRTAFRNMLSQCDYQLGTKRMEYTELLTKLTDAEAQKAELQNVLNRIQQEKTDLIGEKEDFEKGNNALAQEIAQLKDEYHQRELMQYQERAHLMSDAQIQLKLDRLKSNRQWIEGEAKLKEEYRGRDETIAAMKELVHQVETGRYQCSRSDSCSQTCSGDMSTSLTCSCSCSDSDSALSIINPPRSETLKAMQSRLPIVSSSTGVEIEKSDMSVVNNRRSGPLHAPKQGVWLEHVPDPSLESHTVFQPVLGKKKSVNKLVNVKDLTCKTSKYCLRADTQTSDGDVETKLYKGDVLQTVSGGAQMIWNDMEILTQVSPSKVISPPSGITRKRSSQIADNGTDNNGVTSQESLFRKELAAKCSTGFGNFDNQGQGEGKKSRQDIN